MSLWPGRWRRRVYQASGVGVVAAVSLGFFGGTAAADEFQSQPAVERKGGAAGGYATKRVESELSIHVPEAQKEAVWTYLSDVYGGQPSEKWPAGVGAENLRARVSEETFIDRYYDTPNFKVLSTNSGVRYRSRDIAAAPDDPKHDRQLVQVKVTPNGDTVTRGEYKFPVKRGVDRDANDAGPILNLIRKQSYRDKFSALLQTLGVDATSLRQVVRLNQSRRRVYFSDTQGSLATITLDQVKARKWWARASWTELELELDEVRYTQASLADRQRMEALREALRADLFAQFPQLYQDNLPKYTEAVSRLEQQLPMLRPLISVRLPSRNVLVPVATGLLAAAVLLTTRRRSSLLGRPHGRFA